KINETGDPLGSRSKLVFGQTHFVHSNEDVPTSPASLNLADASIVWRTPCPHAISDLKLTLYFAISDYSDEV
ncbi:17765_t:CDS:2, partial [Acaulospora morrowiae]